MKLYLARRYMQSESQAMKYPKLRIKHLLLAHQQLTINPSQ